MSRIPYSTTDYGVTTLANLADVSAEGATDGQELRLESGVFTTKTPHAVHDVTTARMCKEHNDANVIGIGARMVGEQTALDIVDAYMKASFQGGRHQGRIDKLTQLENAR